MVITLGVNYQSALPTVCVWSPSGNGGRPGKEGWYGNGMLADIKEATSGVPNVVDEDRGGACKFNMILPNHLGPTRFHNSSVHSSLPLKPLLPLVLTTAIAIGPTPVPTLPPSCSPMGSQQH